MIKNPKLGALDKYEEVPVRCMKCKKGPRYCQCVQYRIEGDFVYADNVATDVLHGEKAGLWQTRRNSKIYRRPQFIDGFMIMKIENSEFQAEVVSEIERGSFSVVNYRGREGFWIPSYDKLLLKRLPVFRNPRRPKADSPV